MQQKTNLRAPLAHARGLGSAKEGVEHWWMQRLSSIALIPLTLWFVYSILMLAGADYKTVAAWVAAPMDGVLLILLIFATFYHAALGFQVVIEDYIHQEAIKLISIIAVKFAAIVFGAASIFAVLKLALGA